MTSAASVPEVAVTIDAELEDANAVEQSLRRVADLVQELEAYGGEDAEESMTPESFNRVTQAKMDEATQRSQALATYFQQNTKDRDTIPEFRHLHRTFVATMKTFRDTHSKIAMKREAMCDLALLQNVNITKAELDMAKEEESKAMEIAEGAVEVKKLVHEVDTLVHEQRTGIDQIAANAEATKLEIGAGVDELEQAAQLQKEARQKQLLIAFIILMIIAIIVVPIILTYA